jgi:hypothetical protein
MEEIGVISLCLECENFSGKPKYIAKRNNGIKSVNTEK